jgi:hypothetical protein
MKNKQEEYTKIIQSGTIQEIENFTWTHFHEIKHIDSFSILLTRLKNTENELKKKEQIIEKIRVTVLRTTNN